MKRVEVISVDKSSSEFKYMVFDNQTKQVYKTTGDEVEANDLAEVLNEEFERANEDN